MKNIYKIMLPLAAILTLSACQSTQQLPATTPQNQASNAPINFAITGKIGITTQTDHGKQGGSAFYGWSQHGERFAIDLTGALGIGATEIRFDGSKAVLRSERTGEIYADTPEALLFEATGWQAPISQLPYWIVAKNAPADSSSVRDTLGRLSQANNGEWSARFEYNATDTRPNRLVITHHAGHRVVLTISHQKI